MMSTCFYALAAVSFLASSPCSGRYRAGMAIAGRRRRRPAARERTRPPENRCMTDWKANPKPFRAEISQKEDELQQGRPGIRQRARRTVEDRPSRKKVESIPQEGRPMSQRESNRKGALLDNRFGPCRCRNPESRSTEIVGDIAKEKGLRPSLYRRKKMLYADPKLDITSEVLNRLNQKLPKSKSNSTATATKITHLMHPLYGAGAHRRHRSFTLWPISDFSPMPGRCD